MDELSIKMIMILFPGIITTMLLDKIIEHKPWSSFKYSLFIVFNGVMSYAILQFYYMAELLIEVGRINFSIENVKILSVWDFNSDKAQIPYQEVIKAGIASLFWGLLLSFIEHKEWLSSILLKLNISSKYGNYSTNYQLLKLKRNDWIDITIWDKDLFIRGIVVSINELNGLCELCINNAEVFSMSKDMKSLYKAEYISISEPPNNLIISTTQDPTGE
ncbi:hypothetical protein JO83_06810 [Avibacterium paragallinarum]|uniref:hypothetical protein n=1 Tax=Avibacterium paragallinarum TaxID=728 RepID=UPI0010AA2399|nr:hypothetical protein JO83_06810 [Avibacterium paragallinarum]